jgi:hypothetical protein
MKSATTVSRLVKAWAGLTLSGFGKNMLHGDGRIRDRRCDGMLTRPSFVVERRSMPHLANLNTKQILRNT